MENIFLPIFKGKTVIVGIGNPLRGDDGFGPVLIGRLREKIDCVCLDTGNAPENFLGRIVKEEPNTILLIDVAHLGLPPGQFRILQSADILRYGFTTHDISSGLLIDFLQRQTRANIVMLGVQPQQLLLGQPMSGCVSDALTEIESLILEAYSCTRPI